MTWYYFIEHYNIHDVYTCHTIKQFFLDSIYKNKEIVDNEILTFPKWWNHGLLLSCIIMMEIRIIC